MKRVFNATAKKTTFRGSAVYEVDCRRWPEEMKALEYPQRRRFDNLTEAEAWCRQLVVDHTVGRKVSPGRVALLSLSALYLKSSQSRDRSRATLNIYRSHERTLSAFCNRHGIVSVTEMTVATVEILRTELHASGMGPHGESAPFSRSCAPCTTGPTTWGT